MSLALSLAKRGMFSSDPNPRVGCVLAREGQVIATGWHRCSGDAHAEVYALREAGDNASGATAYVTLEPCNHQGRTPACAPQLVQAGISRVVCAIRDDNPLVNGGGFSQLKEAGIQVDTGLMKEQAEALNPGFFKRMRVSKPWVRVKLAQSLDGGIALQNGSSQWISSAESRADVQNWRARSSAIMTGIGTVLADDPSLTVRLEEDSRQPLRVIVDSNWRTPPAARTIGLEGNVIIAGCEDKSIPSALGDSQAELLPLPRDNGKVCLHSLMKALSERSVNEIQVEAGGTLAGSLIEEKLVDEVLIYQAPVILGNGTQKPFGLGPLSSMDDRTRLDWIETIHIGGDLRLRLKPVYGES